jgi:hypothetical protein
MHYSQSNPGLIGPGGDVNEEYCKIKAVQSQLAEILGLVGTLDLVPGKFVFICSHSALYDFGHH